MKIQPPTKKKELRRFIGMINYYRDMWIRRSEILAPLTKMCSSKVKWQWTNVEQTAFENIKTILSKEVLLSYPDFNLPFEIHTDASKIQLGAVISQQGHPIAFYSRKLSSAQTRYTTIEQELLAIVETLKEFRNILLGHKIRIWTDHKNLTQVKFNTDRVMRWRLIIEEYGPEFIHHIAGSKNIVADALSRLHHNIIDDHKTLLNNLKQTNAETFATKKVELNEFPLNFKAIYQHQQQDETLQLDIKKRPAQYILHSFRGGGKVQKLICNKEKKIIIPKVLQNRIVQWYHTYLSHPGINRTEQTIRQHFTWTNLRQTVYDLCATCPTCQRTKRSTVKYGKLPPKEAEAEPWEVVCVDLVGPYTMRKNGTQPTLVFWALTMIDPATGWFEMKTIENKTADNVANIVENLWLSRYPWPQMIIYDQGSEFMAEFGLMVKDDYGIKRKPTTTRNPQANAILERIHQTINNILRTYQIHSSEITTPGEAWEGILSSVMFALRATYHTTLQATPTQLVFGRDAILNIKFEADWNAIRQRKQKLINENNTRENKKRISHEYKVGDKVLYNVTDTTKAKFIKDLYDGPYRIRQINNNGTVLLKKGPLIETINIRQIKPYRE